MAETSTAEAKLTDDQWAEVLVDGLASDGIPNMRPVHAWGIGATGFFVPSDVAADYCQAAHFKVPSPGQKPVPVTARFSNGSGSATNDGEDGPHDGWSDVRGLAVRFHLTESIATDLIGMTLNCFFSPTPEKFGDFAVDAKPAACARESPWRKILDLLRLTLPMPDPYPGQTYRPDEGALKHANGNPKARLAVFKAASIGAPVSYVRATYHAVHTFIVRGADGIERPVRFTWQPIAGALNIRPEIKPGVPNPDYDRFLSASYLQYELRHRLEVKKQPARFSLMMMIGETGDDFNDSTVPWPPRRKRVEMGTLTLDTVAEVEMLSFNPGLLIDGIQPSGDPVLKTRTLAYEYSSSLRGGKRCPFQVDHRQGKPDHVE